MCQYMPLYWFKGYRVTANIYFLFVPINYLIDWFWLCGNFIFLEKKKKGWKDIGSWTLQGLWVMSYKNFNIPPPFSLAKTKQGKKRVVFQINIFWNIGFKIKSAQAQPLNYFYPNKCLHILSIFRWFTLSLWSYIELDIDRSRTIKIGTNESTEEHTAHSLKKKFYVVYCVFNLSDNLCSLKSKNWLSWETQFLETET